MADGSDGHQKKPSEEIIASWIDGALRHNNPEEVIESYFVKYGVINHLDDTQHDLVDGQQDELLDNKSCVREQLEGTVWL